MWLGSGPCSAQEAGAPFELGNAGAEAAVGIAYLEGAGVEPDYDVAVRWLRPAAARKDDAALCSLGYMHAEGWGVPQDAASVRRTLSPEQIREAELRIAAWKDPKPRRVD